jgi:hypothetical protein
VTETGLTWATVAEGFSASVSFAISAEEMDAFAAPGYRPGPDPA